MIGKGSNDRIPARPRLIFMGTPEFALPTLKALIAEGHHVAAVVTQPDRPKGRWKKLTPPPVKLLALEQGLEVLQPEKASNAEFCDLIRGKDPDLIIVVAFGQILKKNLLDIPKWGVINVHGSLLPRYRGAAPIQRSILNNEPVTGLTVMHMDEGMDTGPILFQEEVPVLRDETAGELQNRLAEKSGDLMIRSLRHMAENPVVETPQDDSKATFAPKIERELCRIDWTGSAERISALIRALDPRPGAYTTLEGREVKLFSSRVSDRGSHEGVPGRVVRPGEGGLLVETGQGTLEIREIQYPGKRKLPVADFLRGFSLQDGTLLGK
jgi:methionyl-tRNA formyltransferase